MSLPVFTPAQLRAEGVVEVGGIAGTSVLYVITQRRLVLLDATRVADRALDAYALRLVVTWIEEHGLSDVQIARNLGIDPHHLSLELRRAGYERLSQAQLQQLDAARASRGGNRHGRVLRLAREAGTEARQLPSGGL